MLHADETSLHDDARRLPDAAADVEASAAAISELPPHIKSDTPVVSQTKSAVYEEPGEDGRPHYRGFQDPNSQSQTFKRLQSLIESGEGKSITAESDISRTIFLTCQVRSFHIMEYVECKSFVTFKKMVHLQFLNIVEEYSEDIGPGIRLNVCHLIR